MNLKHIFSALAVVSALAACQAPLNIQDPIVTTTVASYDIPTEGGTIDVTFRANQDWRITLAPANSKSNTAGVSVSPSFGAGSNKPITVTVKASANTDLNRPQRLRCA